MRFPPNDFCLCVYRRNLL
ncbi:hypothetical protein CP8484711_2247A, partial [Chlamydia psittaci 84-8471/1]